MQHKSFNLPTLLFVTLFGTLLLSACGGGGGGGSSIPAEYTGSTEPAVVTSSNAETLALDAYEGGSQTDTMMVVPLSDQDAPSNPSVRRVTSILEKVALSLPVDTSTEPSVSTMATNPPVDGTCGGNYVLTLNESGSTASGSIVFNAYCEDGVTMNGVISFSGSGDSSGNVSMTMKFSNLTSTESGASFGLHGSITVNVNTNTDDGTMILRMVFADNVSQETLFVDYTLGVTHGPDVSPADGWPDYEDVTISGRFYAHHHGYLQISTIDPLHTLDGDFEPSSGKLRFEGANGTWMTYTVTGTSSYEIEYYDGTTTGLITSPAP